MNWYYFKSGSFLHCYRCREEVDKEFDECNGEDEIDASTQEELTPVAPNSEQNHQQSVDHITAELENSSQTKKSSKSVMSQTGEMNKSTRPSVPKHVPEYRPYQKFSRDVKRTSMMKNLVLSKEPKLSVLWIF